MTRGHPPANLSMHSARASAANLRYRRQFIAASKPLASFGGWQHRSFPTEKLEVYVHPEVAVTPALASFDGSTRMLLIGFALDPTEPGKDDEQIVRELLASETLSIDAIASSVSRWAGRFVLIVSLRGRLYVFHDPCGLRSVYYAHREGVMYLGSQPLIFSEVFPLLASKELNLFQSSEYVSSHIEYWVPSGASLYEGVRHLLPNHYLDMAEQKQRRYWPLTTLPKAAVEAASEEAAICLRGLMQAARARFRLALPLTAGWDSRTVLAACREVVEDVCIYTLLYRDLTPQSADVRTPARMLRALGIRHHVFDCSCPAADEFRRIYKSNVFLAHDDWCGIAYGLWQNYPQDRVCIKGNCSEIARCFYYKWGAHEEIRSGLQLAGFESGWAEMPFIVDQLDEWLKDAREVCLSTGMDVLDLFYWEHRMGSWQAQSQTEWDIAQEAFTPFNCRPLLLGMLAVPNEYRRAENYALHRRVIERLWPQLLKWPINPPPNWRQAAKRHAGAWLRNIGAYELVKKQYDRVRRLMGR